MAIRIQRLICNVTVHTLPSTSAAAESVMTSRELPLRPPVTPSTALQRALEAGGSAIAEGQPPSDAEATQSTAVDSRKLADQVYRLMLEDLRIARERE